MTETSYPFTGQSNGEAEWAAMAPLWAPSGIVPESSPVALGSGLTFSLPAGFSGWVRGFYYNNSATLNKTGANNTNSSPRIHRLVLRLDRTANTIVAAILIGTPAASPVPPALQQDAAIWEYPLAYATAPGSASAQNYSGLNLEYEFTGRPAADVRQPRVTGTLLRSDGAAKLNAGNTSLKLVNPNASGAAWDTGYSGRGLALARSGWYSVDTMLRTAFGGFRYIEPQIAVVGGTQSTGMVADTSQTGFGSGGGNVLVYVPPHQSLQMTWNAYSSATSEADILATTRVAVTWLGYQLGG